MPSTPPDYPIWASAEIIAAADYWLAEDAALVARLFRPGMQYAWREITKRTPARPGHPGISPHNAMEAIARAYRLAHRRHPSRQEELDRYRAIATQAAALARLLRGTPLEWTPWPCLPGWTEAEQHREMWRQLDDAFGPRPKGIPVIEQDRLLGLAVSSILPIARGKPANSGDPNPPEINLTALLAILAAAGERQAEIANSAPRLVPSPGFTKGEQRAGDAGAKVKRLAFIRSLALSFERLTGDKLKGTVARITTAALDLHPELTKEQVASAFKDYTPPPPAPIALSFPGL